jgi:methylenetetrahydrofolate dehydrogenase (NADP+) / methenyltetrahydrofolate cyclohydrolase
MSATLLQGQPVVDAMLQPLEAELENTTLAVVQVGGKPESNSYVKQLRNTAKRLPGLTVDHIGLAAHETLDALHLVMKDLNRRPEVAGYMLQLPLPSHLQERLQEVRHWIAPEKDIDLFGYTQRGVFLSEKRPGQLLPPTPYAVMKMLQHARFDVRGKVVVVVGDGMVGSMLKVMLGNDKATQIVCNEHTPDLASFVMRGDVVVGAAGVPNIITGDMLKPGAVAINVGMKWNEEKKIMEGDIDVDSVMDRASIVTPVKGGTGPATVAALVQNVFRAARMRKA